MLWHSFTHQRIAQLVDFLTAILSFIAAYQLSIILYKIVPTFFPPRIEVRYSFVILMIFLSFIYCLIFDLHKAYNYQRFTSLFREYSIIVKVCFIGSLLSIAVVFLTGLKNFPRTILIISFFVSLILFITEKTFLFYIANYIRRRGKNRKKILLIGTGTRARHFIETVKKNFHW